MMKDPLFLTVENVLAIHARVVREFGGSPEIKDFGLLESAVIMPSAQFGGKFLHKTSAEMAGAYLFHLCQNHPFLDGNKRTALVSAEVFLLLNGRRLQASNRELEDLTFGIAKGEISKKEAIAFFKEHIK